MKALSNAVMRFVREEEGTEMVEWGLVAGLIIVVAAGLFATIGGDLNAIFGALRDQTTAANPTTTG